MAIKDFFKNIGDGVKKASDKLDNAVDVQKIKYNIGKKEDELETIYAELGEAILKAVTEGVDYSEAITKAKEAYAKVIAEIQALQLERREKEGKFLCESCGTEVDSDMDFCPKCGVKIEKTIKEEAKSREENTETVINDATIADA